ncbi:RNA-binding protein [Luteolibacter sp. SL250]|uniref:RNA recognition motif domain-containing protein n=1 Tax=Luteolibacter sp. SL250 TaxID=2995170 RepID=UPI002271BDB5|nr:RNA-binding protein [Luteolibacter sp. SL250]WAC19080.1 RNA-binding protein [Luteolibacter sp. SL250]
MDIYVGNLPYTATEADIRELFSEFGEIQTAKIITDRETGGSKGFGFVTLADQSRVSDAVQALNGHNFHGRPLKVNPSEPRPTSSGGGYVSRQSGGGGGYGGGRDKRNTGY